MDDDSEDAIAARNRPSLLLLPSLESSTLIDHAQANVLRQKPPLFFRVQWESVLSKFYQRSQIRFSPSTTCTVFIVVSRSNRPSLRSSGSEHP